MLNTTENILDIMRTKKFALEVLRIVEEYAGLHFLSLHYLGGARTVREWGELAEDDKRQQTVQTTVRLCHDFEYAIAKVLKDNYGLTILSKSDETNINGNYDVAIDLGGESVLAFEVKSTQADKWQGSTHSTGCGKVPFYVGIQFDLDLDIELGEQSLFGLFKTCHFCVTSPLEDGSAIIGWKGEATKSNSSTNGQVLLEHAPLYENMVVLGEIDSRKKSSKHIYLKTIKEDLTKYRTGYREGELNPDYNLQQIDIEPIQLNLFE